MKKFILWDPKDGMPPVREGVDGTVEVNSGGILGVLTEDNVYLTTYAQYPKDTTHRDLAAGECEQGVKFNLSGESGFYEVHRVQ